MESKDYTLNTRVVKYLTINQFELGKLKLFEHGINYILTYQFFPSILLNEILLLSDKTNDIFTLLNNHKNYFKYFDYKLTRSISYLIILIYLKFNDQKNNYSLDFFKLNTWFLSELNIAKKDKIFNINVCKKYINEVSIKNGYIKFLGGIYNKYPEISLNKLNINYYKLFSINYTKKLYNIQIYNNPDNECKGLVRYWLTQRAEALLKSKSDRALHNLQIIKSLESKNNLLLNSFTDLQVKIYQNNNLWNCKPLEYLQNLIGNNLANLLMQMLSIIKNNNLNNLFAEIQTTTHAMAVIIILKGNLFNLIFYDPNDNNFSFSYNLPYNPKEEDLLNYINHISYFNKYNKNLFAIIVNCYYLNIQNKTKVNLIDNSSNLQSINYPKVKEDILFLAVVNNDSYLTELLLNKIECDINILYNNLPIIYSAVFNSNLSMVKLLVKNNIVITKNTLNELINLACSRYNNELIQYLQQLDF